MQPDRRGLAAAAPPPWGLALVRMLSLGWGVTHRPTRVWLQLPRGGAPA